MLEGACGVPGTTEGHYLNDRISTGFLYWVVPAGQIRALL